LHRTLIFFIAAILFYIVTNFSGGNVGVSSECIDDTCLVVASTSILSIGFGIIFLVFAVMFPRATRNDSEQLAGVWRRFGAFLIDFIVIILALSPILALPAIVTEYTYTNEFLWSFQREFSRSTDNAVIIPSVFILFAGLAYYFYKFTLLSKPTIGQYILGYRIIVTSTAMSKPVAFKRVSLSMLGMCAWPIAIIHGLIKKRVFWWDSGSGSRAILTLAANKPFKQDK
jgi:uncharacterized RDD family membrane protein YckC